MAFEPRSPRINVITPYQLKLVTLTESPPILSNSSPIDLKRCWMHYRIITELSIWYQENLQNSSKSSLNPFQLKFVLFPVLLQFFFFIFFSFRLFPLLFVFLRSAWRSQQTFLFSFCLFFSIIIKVCLTKSADLSVFVLSYLLY